MRIAIVGGGLAGLACAKSLVDAGHAVELFEGLPYLGGRASTFRDDDGEHVEQGLHVFLGQYRQFLELLKEIGVDPDEILFWNTSVCFHDAEDGTSATFGTNPVRSPLKTLMGALTQNDYLDGKSKVALVDLVAPALTSSWASLEKRFDGLSVRTWWKRKKAPVQVLERILRPLCRGLQFAEPEQYSAFNMLGLVHHVAKGLPNNRLGGYVGARNDTIFAPLQQWLEARGAVIHTDAKLTTIRVKADRVVGLKIGGRDVSADAYVMALPVWELVPRLPAALKRKRFFAALVKLPVAPAISVQLWFDREVVADDTYHLVANAPAPVFQEQARRTYPTKAGSRVSVIVSPADALLRRTDASLTRLVVDALAAAQPEVGKARVTKSVVLRHRKHLVRPLPGAMTARPTQATPVPNLFFAGDWTQQDFFGSQEGAVRSGRLAAQALLEAAEEGRLSSPPARSRGRLPRR